MAALVDLLDVRQRPQLASAHVSHRHITSQKDELKLCCAHFGHPVGGNKPDLAKRLESHVTRKTLDMIREYRLVDIPVRASRAI